LDLQIATVTHYFNGGHPVGTKILIDSESGSTVAVLGVIRAKNAIVEKTAFLQLLLKEEFDERSKKLKKGKERTLYKLGYTV
jgi:hypothetical protein